ncbi:MAG: hypothetical protein DRJ42_02780 [Deltaproteobacteria bacterium]|nr:MAG: hypothetical protein DRJ42_02780 [Deltaproteobacteria bacterium]
MRHSSSVHLLSISRWALCLALFSVIGCDCSDSPDVDGGPVDAGDAGDAGDSGTAGDSGAATDSGTGDADAGGCTPACMGTARCRFGTCVPDLGTCTTHDDCPGDSYCSADGECLPYGVPPEVINDPACQRPNTLEDVLPTVQCEWTGPAAGDPNTASALIYTAPIVADLNLDEDPGRLQPSIIATTWFHDSGLSARIGTLRIFDGRTCEEQLQIGGAGDSDDANRPGYGTQWAVVDLDGDVPTGGHPEIIGMHRTTGAGNSVPLNLYALSVSVTGGTPSANRLWYGRDCETGTAVDIATNSANFGPGVFDLDDDGDPEILIGTMVFDHLGCLQNAVEPVTYITHGPMHTAADVDLDGRVELVTGTRIAEWDPVTTEWVDESYFSSLPAHRTGHIGLADLGQYSVLPGMPTPNNLPEVIVVSAETNVFDPTTTGTIRVQTLDGTVIFGPIELHHSTGVAGGHGGAPTASDFDGDGQVEFAAAANEFYAVYDFDCDDTPDSAEPQRPGGTCVRGAAGTGLPNGVLWAQPSSDFSSSGTGSSIFDFNGDGRGEAVYRDECYLRVYDGANGEVLFSTPASSGTGFELPIIADVDGDFATEIVVARTMNTGCPAMDPLFPGGDAHVAQNGFVILRDPEDRWASSRPIWNQHAYSVTHVTDDAQVVQTSAWQQNWTVPGLNNFRQNVQGDLGVLNIADLTVVFFNVDEICTAELPADLDLRARVCNRGTNPVIDGVTVRFTEGAVAVCESTTTRLLEPGECEEIGCRGTVTSADELLVEVDPDDEVADCHPGNDLGAPAAALCLF